MAIEDIDDSFETEMGVPHLTVELSSEQKMFPYHSFCNAVFQGNRITIELNDWQITIEGKRLSSLWRQLQVQDVRVIRCNSDRADGQCFVSAIVVKQLEELVEEPDL